MVFSFPRLCQVVGQRIEAVLPKPTVEVHPPGGFLNGPGHETAVVDAAFFSARKQSRSFEHTEVLRDGGQRDVEGFGQPCHRRRPLRQAGQDRAAGRVGQGGECCIQYIVNHMVNYKSPDSFCQL